MSDYDTDFYRWTQKQAAALRAKDFAALDLENLAEEVESLGRSDRRAIVSHLERLLLHLLKWREHPQGRGPSGRAVSICPNRQASPASRRACAANASVTQNPIPLSRSNSCLRVGMSACFLAARRRP